MRSLEVELYRPRVFDTLHHRIYDGSETPVFFLFSSADCEADGVKEERPPSSSRGQSPDHQEHRNPSPPPDTAGGDEDAVSDAIGDTVYSKHWLFSTLTRLISVGCHNYYCLQKSKGFWAVL